MKDAYPQSTNQTETPSMGRVPKKQELTKMQLVATSQSPCTQAKRYYRLPSVFYLQTISYNRNNIILNLKEGNQVPRQLRYQYETIKLFWTHAFMLVHSAHTIHITYPTYLSKWCVKQFPFSRALTPSEGVCGQTLLIKVEVHYDWIALLSLTQNGGFPLPERLLLLRLCLGSLTSHTLCLGKVKSSLADLKLQLPLFQIRTLPVSTWNLWTVSTYK